MGHMIPKDYKLSEDHVNFKVWAQHSGRLGAGTYRYFIKGDADAVTEYIKGMYILYPTEGYSTHFTQFDNPNGDGFVFHGYRSGSCD